MIKILIVLFSTFLFTGVQAQAPAQTAIIVSGGGDMGSNDSDFIADLDRATSVFSGWNRSTFYADGGDAKGSPNLEKLNSDGFPANPIDGLYPRFTRVLPAAPVTGPADYSSIADQIRQRVSEMEKNGDTASPIILYFTDHGGIDTKTGEKTIVLWNNQSISVEQLRSLLDLIPQTHTVEVINDHCFGGAMAEALFDSDGKPRPRACSVSPSSPLEASNDNEGWMLVAKELKTKNLADLKKFDLDHDGFISAHEVINAMSIVKKMDSLPISSSDIFAMHYLEKVQKEKKNQIWSESVCSNDVKENEISKIFSNSLLPLVHQSLDRYRLDLKAALSGAGLDDPCSLSDLQKKIQDAKEDLRQKTLAMGDADDALSKAKKSFLTLKLGKDKLDAYYSATDKVDKLETKLDVASSETEKAKLRADLKSAQGELAPYASKVNSIWSGLDYNNLDFTQFVQTNGDVPPNSFHKDAIQNALNADDAWTQSTNQLRPLTRASRDLTTLTALESMNDRQDTAAMSEYAGMLQCENTPIFKVSQ